MAGFKSGCMICCLPTAVAIAIRAYVFWELEWVCVVPCVDGRHGTPESAVGRRALSRSYVYWRRYQTPLETFFIMPSVTAGHNVSSALIVPNLYVNL